MTYVLMGIGAIVALIVTMQVAIRVRARLLRGKPLPALPGSWPKRLGGRGGSVVYFFSPGCAACRSLTPRFKEMSHRRPGSVFLVDVAEDLRVAQAFQVMATPSVVEVVDGPLVGYHIGPPPSDLMARYA